jgi:hypothetical protein
MQQPIRLLNATNIGAITVDFHRDLSVIGRSIVGLTGLPLLIAVKRNCLGHGPYPKVTLFEAANRIMSDLVILHGVAGLLENKTFPFTEYKVEFGNEDRNGFDIRASSDAGTLVGEAFNVAPSFFQGKKRTALKKLRDFAAGETYRLIMFNEDAPPKNYLSRAELGIQQIAVHIPTTYPPSGA